MSTTGDHGTGPGTGSSSLCRLAELPQGSRGLLRDESGRYRLVVVRRGDTLHAYRNRCPHTGAPLEWRPHDFLDPQGRHLQCSLHGALFRIEDGLCLAGPCRGESLQRVALELRGEHVVLPEGPGQGAPGGGGIRRASGRGSR